INGESTIFPIRSRRGRTASCMKAGMVSRSVIVPSKSKSARSIGRLVRIAPVRGFPGGATCQSALPGCSPLSRAHDLTSAEFWGIDPRVDVVRIIRCDLVYRFDLVRPTGHFACAHDDPANQRLQKEEGPKDEPD